MSHVQWLSAQQTGCYRLQGSLDHHSVLDVLQTGVHHIQLHARLTLDLSGISFSNSAGVALLLHWWRTAQHLHHQLILVDCPAQLKALIRLSETGAWIGFKD